MASLQSRQFYFWMMRIIGAVWYLLFFGLLLPIVVAMVSMSLDQWLIGRWGIGVRLSWMTLAAAGFFLLASVLLLAVSGYTLHRCGKGWPWSVGPHVAYNPQCLVQAGPYRIVRHPMADAYLLYLWGIACLLPSLVMFVWFVPIIGGITYEYLEYTEEIRLRRWFGEVYERYHQLTPSLIPRRKLFAGGVK